jgi:hypothetical protein
MKRISRGTPYILTTDDIGNALASIPPRVEEAIAYLLNMTVDDWRAQTDRIKVKQLVDFQNAGAFAATLATAAKAIGDLEEVAFPVITASVDEELRAALDLLNEQVQKHDAMLAKVSK